MTSEVVTVETSSAHVGRKVKGDVSRNLPTEGERHWGLETDEKVSGRGAGSSFPPLRTDYGDMGGSNVGLDHGNNHLVSFPPRSPPPGINTGENRSFLPDAPGRMPWLGETRQFSDGGVQALDPAVWNSPRMHERSNEMVQGDAYYNHMQSANEMEMSQRDSMYWRGRVGWLEEQLRHRDRVIASLQVKEEQLLNEKRSLETSVAGLRVMYDEQQRGLTEATNRALAYRQQLLDDNLRLCKDAEEAQRDRATYIAGLVPLLAEFGLHPMQNDAYAMVHGFKMVVQKLMSEISLNERRRGVDIRREPIEGGPDMERYNPRQDVISALSHDLSLRLGMGNQPEAHSPEPMMHAGARPRSPYVETPSPSNNSFHTNSIMQNPMMSPPPQFEDLQFGPPGSRSPRSAGGSIESHYSDSSGQSSSQQPRQPEARPSEPEGSSSSSVVRRPVVEPRMTASRYEPSLGIVPEHDALRSERPESSSHAGGSFSGESEESALPESALPGIEGLRVMIDGEPGEPVVGSTVIACGNSVNGTSLCKFKWARHYNGHCRHLDNEILPTYKITADDWECILEVRCTPLDDNGRKGKETSAFCNEGQPIQIDETMKSQLESYQSAGRAVFDCTLYQNEQDPQQLTLLLKRDNYNLRQNRMSIFEGRYTAPMAVEIPEVQPVMLAIDSAEGPTYYLELGDSRTRDLAVLTMRQFMRSHTDGAPSTQAEAIKGRNFLNSLRRIVGKK